jgi:phage shock protein PspC (stress-responsive transcriptional regulator)
MTNETQQPQPRRFTRTRRGRLIGGVSSGLGSYFGVDPLLFRIGFVALSFFGGSGAVLYLAFLLLVPEEGARRAPIAGLRRSWATILGAVVLIAGAGLAVDAVANDSGASDELAGALGSLAATGLGAAGLWYALRRRSARGDESPDRRMWRCLAMIATMSVLATAVFAAGGYLAGTEGTIAGWAVVAVGAALVVAALTGRTRWLILPAIAFTLPVTLVTAADADLRGGVGERVHRPGSVADMRDSYRLGVGRLEVDLRDVRFPAGDTPLDLRIGTGELVVLVPDDVCVTLRSRVGGGYAGVLDREHGGLDVSWSNDPPAPPPGTPRLVIDGDVGLGALFVADRPFEGHGRHNGFEPGKYGDNDACRDGGDDR